MTDDLRTLRWAAKQLDYAHERSARRFLEKHGVRVVRGRFLESEFYRVWSPDFDPESIAEEVARS